MAERVVGRLGIDPAAVAPPDEGRTFGAMTERQDVRAALSVLAADAVLVAPGDPERVPGAVCTTESA